MGLEQKRLRGMRYEIINPCFSDLAKIVFADKVLIRSGSTSLSDPDFLETNFKYFPDKAEPNPLDWLSEEDKARLGDDIGKVEKYLVTLFPTSSYSDTISSDSTSYFSTLVSQSGEEILCVIIPEDISEVTLSDSHGEEAVKVWFDGSEISDSKLLYILTTYKGGNPRILNLSYMAYQSDKEATWKMPDYVLRNDAFVSRFRGLEECDLGYIFSGISGSLIGTVKLGERPLYEFIGGLNPENAWNSRKRYGIGDKAMIGNVEYESVEPENIGNHPFYSRTWIKSGIV